MGTVENVFDNGVTVLKIGMNSDFNLTLAYWAFVVVVQSWSNVEEEGAGDG